MTEHPRLLHTVLDATDVRRLAEFYRQLLGLVYRPGDEPPAAGEPDPNGREWLVLRTSKGARALAFQQVEDLPRATWPEPGVPQQMHLDLGVATTEELDRQHERALALGARLLLDGRTDPEEPIYVYADPEGHPFCVFVTSAAAADE
jgi:catechol 2,3-dioxygenase-like lactoylglutathione lyase family enzyme